MKKIIVFILSIFLVCNCFASDNSRAYDIFVESTANAYVLASKLSSAITSKAKQLDEEYEVSDNINKFIKENKFDKKLKDFNKSVDEFTDDVQKQVKKISKDD